jgi:hypothetical protein
MKSRSLTAALLGTALIVLGRYHLHVTNQCSRQRRLTAMETKR